MIDSYPGRVLIGEIYLPLKDLMTYYGQDLNGANLPFNFLLLQSAWNAQAVGEVISGYMSTLPQGAWPNWVLGNHDNPRIASRVGHSQAAIAAMLLFTLPGTLTIYYGEEIGMTNALIRPEDVRDPAEKRQPGIGMGRDPERSPMTWDCSENAGFTHGRPWLPLVADHRVVNVEVEEGDGTSIVNLYRRLIVLRRAHTTLVSGKLRSLKILGDLLIYERVTDHELLVIFLNFGHHPVQVVTEGGTVLVGTDSRRDTERVDNFIKLQGSEGLVIKVASKEVAL
ncbi:MAG TPA: alpha-amylase family glycosyl hydrolase [Edaphobacter sp.]